MIMSTKFYDSDARRYYLLDELRALIRYRTLLGELILRNIKTRYKRSVMGVAWTMLNPLLTMLVLYVVFSQLFAFSVPYYPAYLLSGLLLWNFFAQSTVAAMRDLVWSGDLLQRIFIPRALFAVAAMGTGLVNLLLALVPLAIIGFCTGVQFSLAVLFLPVSLILAGMFALRIGLGLSTLVVFFTDILDMYQIILLAWMYLTPIFYPIDILAPKFHWLIATNPMYYILECFRMPIYLGVLPEANIIAKALLAAVLSLFLGGWLFARKSDEFTYYI